VGAPIRPPDRDFHLEEELAVERMEVEKAGKANVAQPSKVSEPIPPGRNDSGIFPWTEEPWVLDPNEFSAPSAKPGAFSSLMGDKDGRPIADSGFLGKAVRSVHTNLEYWEATFEDDPYVMSILRHGYKIPVKMNDTERRTRYRERNNQSAHNKMDFVRAEVSLLLEGGQVVECEKPPLCVNSLSVAFKVNGDGSIKKRLVMDLSRWVNKFVVSDRFKMSRFQDALSQSSKGDYQSIFDISKAYHHLRLSPKSYDLVGFCVPGVDGKERFNIFMVVVFRLGPAGHLLGRVMKPILTLFGLDRDPQHDVRGRRTGQRGYKGESRQGLRDHDRSVLEGRFHGG
jgi:hypothetical protein